MAMIAKRLRSKLSVSALPAKGTPHRGLDKPCTDERKGHTAAPIITSAPHTLDHCTHALIPSRRGMAPHGS